MKLDNQFKNIEPNDDSICMAFNNESILANDGDYIIFPRYQEIKYEISAYIYLFSLDDKDYFLVDLNSDEVLGYDLIPIHRFRTMKPKELVFAGMTAYHLYTWYRNNVYCGRCGSRLRHGKNERALICDNCGYIVYPKIMPAVIVGVIKGDEILVTQYKDRPYRGYALIAGFTEIGETAEETVMREVNEETGLQVKDITYYKSQPWGIAQDLLLGYFCYLDGDDTITIDEDELAVAKWVSREDLDIKHDDISLTNDMLWRFKNGEL